LLSPNKITTELHNVQANHESQSVSLVHRAGTGPRLPARLNLEGVAKMKVTSTAFQEGANIPKKYTGDGDDVSPPLKWEGTPAGTKSFALICDDPDAPRGTWVHWVLFNIPADKTELPEAVPTTAKLASGARQGTNDFKKIGYGGPAPPPGKPHRYFFKLYALDRVLDLPEGPKKKDVEDAMDKHVLAHGQLMGTYGR
jgi:Raf kinase inhibitor-like YbhB/YbcL family protein